MESFLKESFFVSKGLSFSAAQPNDFSSFVGHSLFFSPDLPSTAWKVESENIQGFVVLGKTTFFSEAPVIAIKEQHTVETAVKIANAFFDFALSLGKPCYAFISKENSSEAMHAMLMGGQLFKQDCTEKFSYLLYQFSLPEVPDLDC